MHVAQERAEVYRVWVDGDAMTPKKRSRREVIAKKNSHIITFLISRNRLEVAAQVKLANRVIGNLVDRGQSIGDVNRLV